MSWRERLRDWAPPLLALGSNPITLLGAALTTSAGLTIVAFWTYDLLQTRPVSAYAGIIAYLILPGVFAAGLLLMPLGALWRRWRLRRRGVTPTLPQLSFRDPVLGRAALLVSIATALNVAIMGAASYRGVEHMDSVQFCGQTCHTVMEPEYAAYLGSPHARVGCVECHIGPGAPWFVRSKLSGTRQIFAVLFHTYSRPIPSPVRHLRPARETCEHCHWPAKFQGDRLVVRTKYAADEHNTPLYTVLVMRIGGHRWKGGVGIHGRHLDTTERIEYLTRDQKRLSIERVWYRDDDGRTVEFVADPLPEPLTPGPPERRKMDCMDCHNRPSHSFELPEQAVDRALEEGRISVELPFVKKEAVTLLRAGYPDTPTARQAIAAALAAFYRDSYPEVWRTRQEQIAVAGQQLGELYARNVFPRMKVDWGTYPTHLGHESSPGCFRCHDEGHRSADGRTITQDCSACHEIKAQDEPNPKILAEIGIK